MRNNSVISEFSQSIQGTQWFKALVTETLTWSSAATACCSTSRATWTMSPIMSFSDEVWCLICLKDINTCLIFKGVGSWTCLQMLGTSWKIGLVLLSSSRYGVQFLHDLELLNIKGLQNDIRPIQRGLFDIQESVVPVMEELNGSGDNRVILWYVSNLVLFSTN